MLCFTIYSVCMYSLLMKCLLLCIRGKVWQIVWVVDELAGSPKFWVHIPQFTDCFKDNVLNIAGSDFSCGLVFDVQVASFMLNPDDSISCSPFEVPSPTLNPGSALSVIFSAVRNLWSSKYFFAMDSDS